MNFLKRATDYTVFLEGSRKCFRSKNYNYDFNLKNGYFARWGEKEEDDPEMSIYGPEILDIEVTTKCNGIDGKLCAYCYKSNTPKGTNMSLETFKKVIDEVNFNQQLTQVAFGLDSTAEANPDLWAMCDYLRENHIIPNGTVAQLTMANAVKIVQNFGGVAISYHSDFEVLADTVDLLNKLKTERDDSSPFYLIKKTLQQINIHFMISEETYEECLKLVEMIKTDARFEGLNAVVLLGLKKCGRAEKGFNRLSDEHFSNLVNLFMSNSIGFGFDSCSANRFEAWARDDVSEKIGKRWEKDSDPDRDGGSFARNAYIEMQEERLKELIQMIEPCESGLFSSYVDVNGNFYPCSFNEKPCYKFDVINGESLEDFKDKPVRFKHHWDFGLELWRMKLRESKRSCPEYEV